LRPFQVLVQGMLDAWGSEGLEQHTRTMQKAYAHRAQVVLAAAGALLRFGQGQGQVWR
jgi:DNA-binding transcriptional MocR family regulator